MDFSDVNVAALIIYGAIAFTLYCADRMLTSAFIKKPQKVRLDIMSKKYSFYRSFTPTSNIIKTIADGVRSLEVYTDAQVRYNAVYFFEGALKLAGIVFAIILFGYQDLLSASLGFVFSIIVINAKVNKGIDSINRAIVSDMSVAIGRLREAYIRTNSIPDSFNAIQTPFLLDRHFQAIYKMLTTNQGDKQLSDFCKRTPNRIIRTFATSCYLRNDSGDAEGSTFNDTLSVIKDEVDAENIRLFNQQVMFKSLDKLPLYPILAYPVLVFVYTHIITATAAVFDSFWGYIIKLANLIASMICYYILTTINNSSNAGVDDRSPFYTKLIEGTSESLNKDYFTNKTEEEFKFKKEIATETIWCKLSKSLAPHDAQKYALVKAKLDTALSAKTVEHFYLEKFGNMLLFGVLAMIMCVFVVYVSKGTIYNSVEAASMMSTFRMSDKQKVEMLKFDHEVLKLPQAPTDLDKPEYKRKITYMLSDATEMDINAQVDRVIAKYKTYHNLHFWWWFGIVAVIAAVGGWYSPDVLLHIRTNAITDEAMRDVLQLQTIIAILVTTQLDALSVVYWLMRSSDIHRYQLLNCFNKYAYQPELSLAYLSRTSSIVEFQSIADKLRLAVYDIPLEDAFADLIKDRNTVLKMREIAQEDELKKKRSAASPIAKAPMGIWMVTCFILPILIVTVNSATTLMANLSEIL